MLHRLPVLLFASCMVASTATARPIRFAAAKTFPSGIGYTENVATGDFNGDGYPDLVVTNTHNKVLVFLGNGDGTFRAPTRYVLTFYVIGQAAVGDFNGDGKLDFVVVGGDDAGNGLAFFAGNGDGTFQSVRYFPTTLAGSELSSAVGDFKNNGHLDVYTGGNGSSELILGNGLGGFHNGTLAASAGFNVAVGDFTQDGNLDVVLTEPLAGGTAVPAVHVLLGNGDGTFQSPVAYTGMEEPVGLAVGDFNGDKKLDLAVTDYAYGRVVILLGNGDGTFTNIGQWGAGDAPGSVAVADFNMDGNLDLAVSDYRGGGVTILPGQGDGEFPTSASIATGNGSSEVVVADVNNDGSPDLVVINNIDNSVSVLLNEEGTHIRRNSSSNPAKLGQPVTFTATVEGTVVTSEVPSGTVTFMHGEKILGQAVLNDGTASIITSTLGSGEHEITVVYSGDCDFNPNQSKVLIQTID